MEEVEGLAVTLGAEAISCRKGRWQGRTGERRQLIRQDQPVRRHQEGGRQGGVRG